MLVTTAIVLLALIAFGFHIAVVLGILALFLSAFYSPFPLDAAFGEVAWSHSIDFVLVAIPLFIMMGEILLRSGIANNMYAAMTQWLSWLPGGLMHANIGTSTLFAATSGSSVATAATIGTTAMPQIGKWGYNERLFLGSLAAGGTLGILIPPSINMILYGFLTDTSVPQLFLAGIVPGLMLAGLFMVTILLACIIRPAWSGRTVATSWSARWRSLGDLATPVLLFLIVIGSIYAGWATPTEAAAIGVIASLGFAAWRRKLTWAMLRTVMEGTIRTSAMMILITILAFLLNFVIGAVGLVGQVNQAIASLGWSPMTTMIFIIAIFLLLGMFMDTLAMIVLTIPVVTPIVVGLGFDPVWFGVMMVLIAETSVLTPPIGMLCYVIQGIRRSGRLTDVFIGVAPFVLTLLAMIGILLAFPQIALWLPETYY